MNNILFCIYSCPVHPRIGLSVDMRHSTSAPGTWVVINRFSVRTGVGELSLIGPVSGISKELMVRSGSAVEGLVAHSLISLLESSSSTMNTWQRDQQQEYISGFASLPLCFILSSSSTRFSHFYIQGPDIIAWAWYATPRRTRHSFTNPSSTPPRNRTIKYQPTT